MYYISYLYIYLIKHFHMVMKFVRNVSVLVVYFIYCFFSLSITNNDNTTHKINNNNCTIKILYIHTTILPLTYPDFDFFLIED